MPKVFVTQIPSRRENGAWIPTVDISAAKEFGDLEILLPSGMNYSDPEYVSNRLRDTLLDSFEDGDYLLPLGDPLIMVISSVIIGGMNTIGEFNILKWDRQLHRYFPFKLNTLS